MSSLRDMTCEASTPSSLPNNRRILELNTTVSWYMPWRQQTSRSSSTMSSSDSFALGSAARNYPFLFQKVSNSMEDASALILTALTPDSRAYVREVVANITRGPPHYIGTQFVVQTYPEIIQEAHTVVVSKSFGRCPSTSRVCDVSSNLPLRFPKWRRVSILGSLQDSAILRARFGHELTAGSSSPVGRTLAFNSRRASTITNHDPYTFVHHINLVARLDGL
jgi:hypothetical protein